MITPREMLRDYMTVLNILMQNENVCFDDISGSVVTLATDAGDKDDALPNEQEKAQEGKVVYTPSDIEF